MSGNKAISYLSLILLTVIFVLTACNQDPDFEVYEGKNLSIAVVGEPPEVKEAQIRFHEISFAELSSGELGTYDAVFITEENLSEAAESKYAKIYLESTIPFFFIAANNHIPFTVEETGYNDSWKWTAGKNYAVGVLPSKEDDLLKGWGTGLYNDKKTDEHIKEVYSRIFKVIDGLER